MTELPWKIEWDGEVYILCSGTLEIATIHGGETPAKTALNDAKYIEKAANMFPELMDYLEELSDSVLLYGPTVLHEKMNNKLYGLLTKAKQ